MSNLLLAPGPVTVKVALDPVHNNLATLYMIDCVNILSGFDNWIETAAARLSDRQKRVRRLHSTILYSAYEPDENEGEMFASFSAYLEYLAKKEPLQMQSRFLQHMFPKWGDHLARQNELMDLPTFIAQIKRDEMDLEISDDEFAEAHSLLSDPSAMRDFIVEHLTTMWHEVLAEDWAYHEPRLKEIVEALQNQDYSGQNGYEAIRSVTGRVVGENWREILGLAEQLIFVPSAHFNPYLLHYVYQPVVRIVFGARPTPNLKAISAQVTTELNRADLLVQLRALTDETRLRILEMLFSEGELCAQEIIEQLRLSSSSASRHLSQLSATGYLTEHQRHGKTKCYNLNPDRFQDTLQFLERFARNK